MNKVILMGRLTRDPEIRYSNGENVLPIANFSLAVDRRFARKDSDQTADFINCVAFGKQAEFMEKYFRKGMRALVCGRLQTRNYTNRDGQKVYVTEVIVEEVDFCESKASGDSYRSESMGGGYQPQQAAAPGPMGAGDGFMNIPDGVDEELPFN